MIAPFEPLRRVIPDFDLYRALAVDQLTLDFRRADDHPIQAVDATFRIVYPGGDDGQPFLLVLRLVDVRQFRLPELGGSWFELSELEIEDVADRGMEGIRYYAKDHGGDFACFCADVEVVSLSLDGQDGRRRELVGDPLGLSAEPARP